MLINLCSNLLRLELLYYGPYSADKESELQRDHAIFPQHMEVQSELAATPSLCLQTSPGPACTFPLRVLQFSQLHEPKAACGSVCSCFVRCWVETGGLAMKMNRLLGPGEGSRREVFRSQAVVEVMRTCDIPVAHPWLLRVREEESGVTGFPEWR